MHLLPDSIRVPFGVTVVRINPSIITLNFERTLQKAVPVRPRITGRPRAGHEVAEVSAEPTQVLVAGPKSRVQEIESAFTEPVSVEGAAATVSDTVNIGLEDPVLRIQGSPGVRVTATIRAIEGTRSFGPVAVEVRGGRATLTPARVRVVLRGPLAALEELTALALHPYVDLAELEGSRRAAVAVQIDQAPAGLKLERIEPERVAVKPVATGRE